MDRPDDLSGPRVAVVAMPWYSVWVPSIQLSVLRQCLHGVADVDSYELYVDYASLISTQLYDPLSGGGEFVEEWLFAQHYFRGEGIPYLEDVDDFEFPPLGLGPPEREREILNALSEVTGDYLTEMRDAYDWGQYDVIGFTLGIAQTSASMALAALIRKKYPDVRIIFGGSACLGTQAEGILGMCPYVDVIVRGEAEGTVAPLVQKIFNGEPIGDIAGLTYRGQHGQIVNSDGSAPLHNFQLLSRQPDFDEYIDRMQRFHLRDDAQIMLPFESSRGCWWGEKSQCTFCGLAEDMRYRARDPDQVLTEIDKLYERYGIARFFATDLIMPQEYYRVFLPKIRASDRNYWFYYEIKANVKREHFGLLSGLVHIQPGLESLNSQVLRDMKKGINAAQNVQFLKWCEEYGVKIFSWHLIVGMPKESDEDNSHTAALIPALHHLPPPMLATFELHRFSPIHRNPNAFGLSNLKPARTYYKVFPVADDLIEKFVYRFEYSSESFDGNLPPWFVTETAGDYARALREAVDLWAQAHARGAYFTIKHNQNGATLSDTRTSEDGVDYCLNQAEACLFDFLDSFRKRDRVSLRFTEQYAEESKALGGRDGIELLLDAWEERSFIFNDNDNIVALAVQSTGRPNESVSEAQVTAIS